MYNSEKYKLSRKAYILQCTAEYLVTILVADAFLAKLLTEIGISDSLNGIISSFISLAFMFQLFSMLLLNKVKSVKKTVVVFDVISQLFFMGTYFVVLLPVSHEIKTALVMLCILAGYAFLYPVSPIYFKWANSYVAPDKRGEYSAVKEMISLITGIVFTLVVGFAVDKFEEAGNMNGSFLFLGILILVLNIISFVSYMMIPDCKMQSKSHSLKDIWKNTMQSKSFRSVVTVNALWDIGRYFTIGFMGVYKTKELMLSVGIVQVINIIGNVARIFVSKPFGRYSDKTSFAKGFNLALAIAALGFAFNIFTTPSSVWCVIVFTVLYYVSMAGTNQNSYNMIYSYINSEYVVDAMAVKNCIGGLLGFAASLAGGKLLLLLGENGNTFFGMHVYGQQVLSAISLVFVAAAMVYNRVVLEKKNVIVQ